MAGKDRETQAAAPDDGPSVRAVRAAFSRIRERDGLIGAWAVTDEDRALAEAHERDAEPSRGPLHGVPCGVKDNIDTLGFATTAGSPRYADNRPPRDAPCVALLREAGAIVLGKTVTTEFALSVPAATVNPHDPECTPGGSSSGSAAAVADGMVRFALGSQIGGSIVRPAAFCGVVGIKPTYQAVPPAGVWSPVWSADTLGVLSGTVADGRAVISVMSGGRVQPVVPAGPSPRRVGIARTPFWSIASDEAWAQVQRVAEHFGERGAELSEIGAPDRYDELHEAAVVVTLFEGALFFAGEHRQFPESIGPAAGGLLERASGVSFADYSRAITQLEAAREELDAAFRDVDVIVTLPAPGEAPRSLESIGDSRFNLVWTLLHVPCVHVPTGHGASGMPLGVQLIGRRGDDDRLLMAAQLIENHFTATKGKGPA